MDKVFESLKVLSDAVTEQQEFLAFELEVKLTGSEVFFDSFRIAMMRYVTNEDKDILSNVFRNLGLTEDIVGKRIAVDKNRIVVVHERAMDKKQKLLKSK